MKEKINDALLDACKGRLLEKVNRCLSNGADPNTAGALQTAVNGRPEIVEALLLAGANPNAVTSSRPNSVVNAEGYWFSTAGETILMAAISSFFIVQPPFEHGGPWVSPEMVRTGEQPRIIEMLLSAGANPNAATENGGTALMMAVHPSRWMHGISCTSARDLDYDNIQFVKLLLSAGANPNAATENGGTALMTAANAGHAEVVKLLLSAGADPNATMNGQTILMQTAGAGHAEVVRLLLSAGAKPDAVDDEWNTALDIAKERGHSEIVRILEEAGAE